MRTFTIERAENSMLVSALCLLTVFMSVCTGDEIKTTLNPSSNDKLSIAKRALNPKEETQPSFNDLQLVDSFRNRDFVNSNQNTYNKRMAEVISKLEDGDQYKDSDTSIPRQEYLSDSVDKRAPLGFVSQLGKRFGEDVNIDDEQNADFEYEKRFPMGFTSQLGKRFPMGFTSQLGKRMPLGFTSQLGKRFPMGFTSQLGKRLPMGFTSQLGKRIPMGFTSQLGKRMPMGFTSQLGKRIPMGFTSQLGKRLPMGFTSQLGKRMPMGFTSQLGKRLPLGFTSQLGKRIPMGFNSQLGKRMPMGFTSQLGKRDTEISYEGSDENLPGLEGDIVTSTRKKRSTNQIPWYISRSIPVRLMRGIDRYSFASRLGKRSHTGFRL